MEPTQPSTPEKEKSSPAQVNEIKTSEVKSAQPHGAVFPVLFAVAALLFAGALFFSLHTQVPEIMPPGIHDIQTASTSEVSAVIPDNQNSAGTLTQATSAPLVQETKATCIDSDPKNDIYTKGSVVYTTEAGEKRTVYDSCDGLGNSVDETRCYESPEGSGNFVNGRMGFNCPNGCYVGRCLREGEINPAISSVNLRLISPTGAESLCLGEDFTIQWEGPKKLSTVSLWVYKGMDVAWSLGTFPAVFNESNTPGKGEYVWKVGTSERGAIPEGDAYTIGIAGNYPWSMHKTNDYFQMEKPISITDCRG